MTMGLHFFQGAFMGEAPKWHWIGCSWVRMGGWGVVTPL